MKTERWDSDWFWAKAPAPNEKIKGAYETISGGGNTAEMRYNNGQVVRKLFYFYPDSRTTFGIGDDAYVPD